MGLTVGTPLRIGDQFTDGLGRFTPVVAALSASRFLVVHQEEYVGLDGMDNNPSYLGARIVTVNGDLTLSLGTWVSFGFEASNDSISLEAHDGDMAFLVYNQVGLGGGITAALVDCSGSTPSLADEMPIGGFYTPAPARLDADRYALVQAHPTSSTNYMLNVVSVAGSSLTLDSQTEVLTSVGFARAMFPWVRRHGDGRLLFTRLYLTDYPDNVLHWTYQAATVDGAGAVTVGPVHDAVIPLGLNLPGALQQALIRAQEHDDTEAILAMDYASGYPFPRGAYRVPATFDWSTPDVVLASGELIDDLGTGVTPILGGLAKPVSARFELLVVPDENTGWPTDPHMVMRLYDRQIERLVDSATVSLPVFDGMPYSSPDDSYDVPYNSFYLAANAQGLGLATTDFLAQTYGDYPEDDVQVRLWGAMLVPFRVAPPNTLSGSLTDVGRHFDPAEPRGRRGLVQH